MKKITIWISATLAVLALLIAFQLNASGTSGKEGDGGQRPAAGSTAPSGSPAPEGAKEEGATNDHTGKPGENK